MANDLEKFTTCDLLKTFDKLGEHLQKSAPDKMKEIIAKYGGADMAKKEVAKEAKDYDPNAETPKTTVEEKDKPPAKEVSADKDAKIGKDDYGAPGGMPGGDETSPGTQADVLTQILEAIQDLKAMLAQMHGGNGGVPPGGNGGVPPGGNEVQMADKEVKEEEEEVEKDVPVTAPASEKQIASIVVKALDEKFKELGLVKTEKPSVETSHPIQKAGGKKALTMEEIGKMSWNELNAYLEQ